MNKSVDMVLFVDIILLFFVSIQYLVFGYFDDYYFNLLQIELLLLVIWMIFACYKVENNWFSLEIMFIGTIVIFLLSRIFLNLFFPDIYPAYGESQWKEGIAFSTHTLLEIKFILLFSLIFLHIGFFIGYRFYKKSDIEGLKFSKYFSEKIAYSLFFIGAVAFFYKVYFYFNVLNNHGYFALYSGRYTLPFIVRIFDDFFYLGFFMIIINKPKEKIAYTIAAFFIIMYSTYILTGMRAEFILMFLTTIWLLAFLYQWKINFKYVFLLVMVIVFFSQLTAYIKYNMSLSDLDVKFATGFFYSQGVTLLVLGYIVEFKGLFVASLLDGIRYIVSPFTSKFYLFTGQSGPRSFEGVEQIYSISDRLMYFLNPKLYLAGGGTGSSYIAELYALGGSVVPLGIFSLLLGFLIVFISRRLVYKRYGLFFSVIIIPAVFWMPRGAYVYGLQKYIFAWVLLISLAVIYELIKKREN